MSLKTISRALLVGLGLALLPLSSAGAQDTTLPPASVSVVRQADGVTIHSLVAPGEMMGNASQIIELKDEIFIVDGQFYAPYGAQLKQYVDTLGKPVTRFYISHAHPDHYFGFGDAFPDVPVYALPGVRAQIEKDAPGDFAGWQAQIGALIPSQLRLPTVDVVPGEETVDGVKFEFEQAFDNESEESLIIKLPQAGTYVAQDILYDKVHLFVDRPTAGWRKALDEALKDTRFDLYLPGHGQPGARELVEENIRYLDVADALRAKENDPQAYKAALLKTFPDYKGELLIDIYLPAIFPAQK